MQLVRPSPTESATLFTIGTEKIGNDGNIYKVILTSNNVKRWSKNKRELTRKSIKRSTNKSIKRSTKKPIKRSVKIRSTKKRSVKIRSVKIRSTKKPIKRSVKIRSTKKRSIKKSIKRSTKKRSIKKSIKRSIKIRSTKKSIKRSTKKSIKRSVKIRSTKKPIKRSVKIRSIKKRSTKKRSIKKSIKRSIKKLTRYSIKESSTDKHINKSFNKNTFSAMLAHKYTGQDPTSYYISEKLDGVRAIYDGSSDSFMSRNNKPFFSPKFFSENFPRDVVLDGELYTKRKDFAGTGIFRKKIPISSEWKKGIFMVFDMPLIKLPFEERYIYIKNLLKNIPYLKVVEHTIVKDRKHMDTFHKNTVENNGEGTMLRHKDSYYENKRSHNLLKVKDFSDDEAIVIGYEMGEGRNENLLGALHIKWLDSKMGTNEFKVGSGFNDIQRANWKKLFPKGRIITIKYWDIDKHSKKPRFPIFMNLYNS